MKKKPNFAQPQTAEQVNGPQVGALDVVPDRIIQAPGRKIINQDSWVIQRAVELIAEIRRVRDSKDYLTDGSNAHTFREWCVFKFGEKLGCWIDEML